MSILKFGLQIYARFPGLFAVNILLTMILMSLDFVALVSIAPIVSLLMDGPPPSGITATFMDGIEALGIAQNLPAFLFVFVAINIANTAVVVLIDYAILKTKYIVREDFIRSLSENVLYSSLNYVNRQRQGDFLNTITIEIARLGDAFNALTRMIAPVAQSIILLALPLYISWQTSLITLAAALILMSPIRYFRKHSYEWGRAETTTSNDFTSVLHETLSNVRLISSFGNQPPALKSIGDAFSRLKIATIRKQLIHSIIGRAYAPLGIIVVCIAFLVGQHFKVPLSEITVIIYAFNRLSGVLGTITTQKHQLLSLFPAYEQVQNFTNQATQSRLPHGERPFPGLASELRLDDASYAYPDSPSVVKGVSLTVPRGQMIAIVGASGAGKSTVADLVMGLQRPESGHVLVDGVSLEEYDPQTFRKFLGYVPQQNALFHASIRDNIVWAKPDASDDDIRTACRLANAQDFIEQLDDGLDTVVGDRGVRLSGGQLQRIALARALIRKPHLLVLDEATSSLDSESESLIQKSITDAARDAAVLVIAHRLSTIANADRIYVLDQGRVVEEGTFDELKAKKGTFSRLVSLQQF